MGKHRTTIDRLALAEAESASTRAEVESVRDTLSLAIENYKNSEEIKKKIFEGGFTSFCIGYEDGRDAIEKLYPNLNLSSIIPPCSKEETAKEGTVLTKEDAPTLC